MIPGSDLRKRNVELNLIYFKMMATKGMNTPLINLLSLISEKNHIPNCVNWTELYGLLNIGKHKQSKFRRHCEEYNLIGVCSTKRNKKRFYINPSIVKYSSNIPDECMELFYESIIENSKEYILEWGCEGHPTRGYVYILENEMGRVKIGISKDPEKRIRTIQNASGNCTDSLRSNPLFKTGGNKDYYDRPFE